MKLLPSGKARFNFNIDAELRRKFDEICEARGYAKQSHVEWMIKNWIAKEESLSSKTKHRDVPTFDSKDMDKGSEGKRKAQNE